MAAFFSRIPHHRPVKTIEQLNENFSFYSPNFLVDEWSNINNPIINRVKHRIDLVNHSIFRKDTIDDILRMMNDGGVWLDYDNNINHLIERDEKVYFLEGFFSYGAFGFALRKDWRHSISVKNLIVNYSRSGFIDTVRRDYMRGKEETQMTEPQSISLNCFVGVAFIIVVCGFVSITEALFEICREKYCNMKTESYQS